MQNILEDFQKLTSFENLYKAYQVSKKGKGKKVGTIKFSMRALEAIWLMKYQLKYRRFTISPYTEFVVTEPKRRIIKSGSFKDKVLQHCLCDSVLLPKMNKIFIQDNYAGQIGKGTLYGLDRLSENLHEYYQRHGCEGYILKCDITKFFYSIDHEAMKDIVAYHFPDEGIQWICGLLIDSGDEIGLPLGNQCSQVFALMYLNSMDYMIKDELGAKYYGRYMDDFYIISDNKEYLEYCKSAITSFVETLGLTLNNKTQIVPLRKGIRFLGFHVYITEDGKVIRKLTGDNKREIKKKLRKKAKLVRDGRMTKKEFVESYKSWRNHASHGNCIKLTYSMDLYVEKLFEEYGIK